MAIRAVLFDLDDTLLWDERCVEEAFAAVCHYAHSTAGVDAEQLETEVRNAARALYQTYTTYAFTTNIGINPFEALWGHFTGGEHEQFRSLQQLAPAYRTASWTTGLRQSGCEDEALGAELAERFMRERRVRSYVYEETYDILRALKPHYQLLLLTNGAPDLQQEKLDGIPDIIPFFDHIVISGHHPEGKPAPSLFRHSMSLLGIGPHEGLMVGDKLTTDILGAQNVGMHHAWINRKGVTLTGNIRPEHEITNLMELTGVIESINQAALK